MAPVASGVVNFARDVVDAAAPGRPRAGRASREGARREWTFAEVSDVSAALAGTFAARGVGAGDVVMTLIGNRPEWVLTMVACFRLGAVVLPCTEQLRAKDLRLRLDAAEPALIVADERNRGELEAAAAGTSRSSWSPTSASGGEPAPPARAGARGPVPHHVHLGDHAASPRASCTASATSRASRCRPSTGWRPRRRPRLVHRGVGLVEVRPQRVHRAVAARRRRAAPRRPLRPGRAAGLLERERVNVLCMAPTEYRVIAKRAELRAAASLRGLVAAGEALNPEVLGPGRGDRPADPRRLRPDRDRPDDRRAAGRRRRGPARWAGRSPASSCGRRRRAGRRPGHRADVLRRLPRRRPPPAARLAHRRPRAATRTATCTSRAAPTT